MDTFRKENALIRCFYEYCVNFYEILLTTLKKVLHFVCEPGIDESNTVIQSAIEQAKMKFNIQSRPQDAAGASRPKDEEFLTESVSESLAEMSELEETAAAETSAGATSATGSSSQRLGRRYGRSEKYLNSVKNICVPRYGLQPKFVKMRELHLLMFYLIYGYSGEADLDQADTVAEMKRTGCGEN